MIRTKSDMNLLCQKELNNLTDYECRLLIFNYIFHLKNQQVKEVFTATVSNKTTWAINVHKAYRYYVNLWKKY